MIEKIFEGEISKMHGKTGGKKDQESLARSKELAMSDTK